MNNQLLWLLVLGIFNGVTVQAKDLVIHSETDLPCYLQDEKLGSWPRPLCEVEAQTPWSGAQLYKFNQLGFRGREVLPTPPKDRLRILVLGAALEGVGLGDQELAAHQLEVKLKDLGVHHVEVVNGVVPGFYAGRVALAADRLRSIFNPDVVIYDQSGDSFAFDYAEHRRIQPGPYQKRAHYEAVTRDLRGDWIRLKQDFKTSWHLASKSKQNKKALLTQKSWSALQEIAARFSLETDFFLAWAPRQSRALLIFEDAPFGLSLFFKLITPSFVVPGVELSGQLEDEGINSLLLPREFNQPVQYGLAPAENPFVLTKVGAERWAEGVATQIYSYLKGKRNPRLQ